MKSPTRDEMAIQYELDSAYIIIKQQEKRLSEVRKLAQGMPHSKECNMWWHRSVERRAMGCNCVRAKLLAITGGVE